MVSEEHHCDEDCGESENPANHDQNCPIKTHISCVFSSADESREELQPAEQTVLSFSFSIPENKSEISFTDEVPRLSRGFFAHRVSRGPPQCPA